MKEYQDKLELDKHLTKRHESPVRELTDPNKDYHRDKPTRVALYELHNENLRN